MYFDWESPVWTGGVAFYDPDEVGVCAARAYLITASQFADIATQEMSREPDADLDLAEVLTTGRTALGPGQYETLVCPGLLDGHPVLTFTAPKGIGSAKGTKPTAQYLRYLASGLIETHNWDGTTAARYLADCPGASDNWSVQDIEALISDETIHAAS